jgi:hypothetical protein
MHLPEEDAAQMTRVLQVLGAAGRPLSEEAVADVLGLTEIEVSRLLYRLSLRALARLVGSIDKVHSGGHGWFSVRGKGLWTVADDL